MTLAASLDGNIIYLIAAAAYGVFAWWNDRRQKKAIAQAEREAAAAPQPPPTQARREQAPALPETKSEEERMRKFLEALGVPANPQGPPLRPKQSEQPKAPAPSPVKPATPTMAPRPIAIPLPRSMQSRPAVPQPVAPVPRPVVAVPARHIEREPEPIPRESMEPGRFEEPALAMEQVSADFARIHSQQMAIDTLPSIATAALGSAGTTGVDARYVSPQGLALRDILRNPDSIRAGIVLAEVLGPPKGL